ncbi:hypothetical protein H6P81_009960 [Aristolochia fimbriata]|uniref:BURP domain-containing protein n=1 Tax=Aristolochia fimbriata TaxID=158543 RepID=A0AAV7EPF8_ARIFI|nr:hypothetical protein H6P81_009960 [Aristolochia fimbriata]
MAQSLLLPSQLRHQPARRRGLLQELLRRRKHRHRSFKRYAHNSIGLKQKFANYAPDVNLLFDEFSSYSASGVGGSSDFTSYGRSTNVPEIKFGSYDSDSVGQTRRFASYSDEANGQDQSFSSYGIAEPASAPASPPTPTTRTRCSPPSTGNVPVIAFNSYGDGGSSSVENFKTYVDQINIRGEIFTSYAKNFNSVKANFANYGNAANGATDIFKQYGKGAAGQSIGFKTYLRYNTTFKEYEKKETGTAMKMPDIADKMPPRSFLPRSLAEKLPFSSTRMGDFLKIFKSGRELDAGEHHGEDDEGVRAGAEPRGHKPGTVEIRLVVGINGGKVTKSVSCHQSLFPYLVHFCHSVPAVRVYEADILDVQTKQKINHGVGICHIDTSAWGPEYGAFVALGGGPGKIEVCHWIFQNDMTWVAANR